METRTEAFEIHLPLFEGPFDLLLFFIERDELNIYDIPIAKITNDFLEYLHHMERLDIEIASEFILVASTLMRIKSRMLLPRPQLDEDGNEIDPREELIRHLLEYKKYKSVLESLQQMEEIELKKEKRGNILKEMKKISDSVNVESELEEIDLFRLMKVFQRVLKRYAEEQSKPSHEVIQYPYTIEGQRGYILKTLKQKKSLSFEDLIGTFQSKIAAIFNFLAILEMLAVGQLAIEVGEGYNNFWISAGGVAKAD